MTPLYMGFPRQEFRSGLPFPFPGGLSDAGIEPGSPVLQAESLTSEPPAKPDIPYVRSNILPWLHWFRVPFCFSLLTPVLKVPDMPRELLDD